MEQKQNEKSLESLAAALAYAMGIEPPRYAAAANEDLTAYVDRCLAGKNADRVFIYNTDAIAQWCLKSTPSLRKAPVIARSWHCPCVRPIPL